MKHFQISSLFLVLPIFLIGTFINSANAQESNPINGRLDTLMVKAIKEKTNDFATQREFDSAVAYSNKMLKLSKIHADSILMANARYRLGYYYSKLNQLDIAYDNYNDAFKINVRLKDSIATADVLNSMSNIQKGLGDYIGAKITAVDALNYIDKSQEYFLISALYHVISVCSKELNDYKEALEWNEKAVNMAMSHSNVIPDNNLNIFINTKANILVKYNKLQEAISLYETLLANVPISNKNEYARILANLGYAHWMLNPNEETGEKLMLEALSIRNQNNDISGLIASNIHLTQLYNSKDKELALQYAEAAYKNASLRNNEVAILEALEYVIDLKNALGKNATADATVYSKTRKKLEETTQNIRRIYAVTKYDNDLLSNNILLLKAETAEKERHKIIYLFSFLLVSMASIFSFFIIRFKHKREKSLESYKTETRISKKVHDELANDVYNVMIQLENAQGNIPVLDKLENIYLRTRDISKETNTIKTGKDYPEELSTMIGSYTPSSTKIFIQGLNDLDWNKLTNEKKVVLHRVLQELMTNMKKHSQATIVAITFKKEKKIVFVTYSDNGKGAPASFKLGNGLGNVENRIQGIDGSFTFETEVGKGFTAEIKIPS
ncbi:MAG: tetratricopeptide (TPR) repeat protein [Parvicella sp.]|jgi:tetratricopeptide (TPR) repeat protein